VSKHGAKAQKRAQAASSGGATSPPSGPIFYLCKRCLLPVEAPRPQACPRCGLTGGYWLQLGHTEGLTLEELRQFGQSAESKANLKYVLKARWIASLHLYVETLSDASSAVSLEELGFFWIRLHGALTELREDLAGGAFAGVSDENAKRHSDPNVLGYVRAHRSAMEAVELMLKALSRDLHIYADWRRQTECHLQQSAYTVQVQGAPDSKRRLKVSSVVKALGDQELVTVEERDEAKKRVLSAHQGEDEAVARAVAKLILEPVRQLAAAADDFP
jgi:hypothetical protein